MNKKGKIAGPMQLFFVGVALIALVFGGVYFFGGKLAQQSAAGAITTTTTTSTGGQIQVTTVNPSDTVTVKGILLDSGLKDINATYKPGTIKVLKFNADTNSWIDFGSAVVAPTSSGGSVTGFPVGSKARLLFYNDSTFYMKQYDGDLTINAATTVNDYVVTSSAPNIQVRNVTTYPGVSGVSQALNLTNMGLSAGGSSEQFDIYAKSATSYSNFGQDGIVVACTSLDKATYQVTSDMKEISLTNGMTSDNKKIAFLSPVKSVDTTLTKIGSISMQLKGGQTEATSVNCTVYDVANYLGIDTVSMKSGVEKDDTGYSDAGASNGEFTWWG